MSMRKHFVRTGVLSLLGAALAFAHPTDVRVGSPSDPSELHQEVGDPARSRGGGSTPESADVQESTVAYEEEMRQEKLMHKRFRIAPPPAARRGPGLFEGARLQP